MISTVDPPATVTARALLTSAAGRLAGAGCATPRLDAEILLADVLRVGRTDLFLGLDAPVSAADGRAFNALVARRAAREPVAYIVGRRAFRHLDVVVSPDVLIPRPETELLVEVALDLPRGVRVVDVGTGSGAVALALADERPDLVVTGTDCSAAALRVARANAARLGLPVRFLQADVLSGAGGPFDAVVANLPYVADGDMPGLSPEIRCHEPAGALAGGPDGLDVVRRLIGRLPATVALVALEIGAGQAGAVQTLLCAAGFASAETRPDLAGIDRVVIGRRA